MRSTTRAWSGCSLGLAVLAVLAGSCGGKSTPAPPRTEANRVDVTEVEYRIDMPGSLPAGSTTFAVTNNGAHEHNFEVQGMGLDRKLDRNLGPGETGSLTVDLGAGSYDVFCPIDDHRSLGMFVRLTVTAIG